MTGTWIADLERELGAACRLRLALSALNGCDRAGVRTELAALARTAVDRSQRLAELAAIRVRGSHELQLRIDPPGASPTALVARAALAVRESYVAYRTRLQRAEGWIEPEVRTTLGRFCAQLECERPRIDRLLRGLLGEDIE